MSILLLASHSIYSILSYSPTTPNITLQDKINYLVHQPLSYKYSHYSWAILSPLNFYLDPHPAYPAWLRPDCPPGTWADFINTLKNPCNYPSWLYSGPTYIIALAGPEASLG